MRTTRVLQRGLVVVGIAVLLTAWLAIRPSAQPASPVAVQIDHRRHWRGGHQYAGAGSRRLGDRGDDRPGHQIRQERGHR